MLIFVKEYNIHQSSYNNCSIKYFIVTLYSSINLIICITYLDPNYEPADKPAKKLKSETKIMVSPFFNFLCILLVYSTYFNSLQS